LIHNGVIHQKVAKIKMALQVLLRELEKPIEKNLEDDINWICESFGFYERIDKKKRASCIFKELLRALTDRKGLTSTELGQLSDITRGAALNHLKRMMASGFVIKEGNKYLLRSSSLYETINEIHRDIDRLFENIEQIAIEIDERMGIKRRL